MHTVFWSEDLRGRDHAEDLGANGRIQTCLTQGRRTRIFNKKNVTVMNVTVMDVTETSCEDKR
jgi:hypothetical protein